MRTTAAALVVLFHLGFYSWASDSRYTSTAHALHGATAFAQATPFTWFGWVGVEVFFVISGLVIANSAAGASSWTFLRGRALRLLPAAWICATITLLVRIVGGVDGPSRLLDPYLASLTLWPRGPWIDGVYWSLAVEVTFYALVFSLLLFRAFKHLPLLARALLAASAAFLLLKVTHLSWRVPGWDYIALASEPLLLRHGVFFAIGVWLWMWSERRLSRVDAIGLAAALPIAWLEIWMRAAELQGREAPASIGQPTLIPILIWTALVAVLAVVIHRPERFTPHSAAVRTIFRRVGLLTYPLYLVHNVVGATFIRRLVEIGTPRWMAFGLACLAAVGLAALVASMLEPWVRRAFRWSIDRFAERGSHASRAVAPMP